MATPPIAARATCRREIMSRLSSPIAAQTISSVAAPKTQRQNTTSMTDRREITTNQLIVPEITIAAVISAVPHILSVILAPLKFQVQVYLAYCRDLYSLC